MRGFIRVFGLLLGAHKGTRPLRSCGLWSMSHGKSFKRLYREFMVSGAVGLINLYIWPHLQMGPGGLERGARMH